VAFKLSEFQVDAVIEAIEARLDASPHLKPAHANSLRTAKNALSLQRPERKILPRIATLP
jgi:hypothetical protein